MFLPNFALILLLWQFPNPYVNEAANGSFIILITFNPVISNITLFAFFCLSIKYAGL